MRVFFSMVPSMMRTKIVPVNVEHGIEDEPLQGFLRVSLGRGNPFHHRLQDLARDTAVLGRDMALSRTDLLANARAGAVAGVGGVAQSVSMPSLKACALKPCAVGLVLAFAVRGTGAFAGHCCGILHAGFRPLHHRVGNFDLVVVFDFVGCGCGLGSGLGFSIFFTGSMWTTG